MKEKLLYSVDGYIYTYKKCLEFVENENDVLKCLNYLWLHNATDGLCWHIIATINKFWLTTKDKEALIDLVYSVAEKRLMIKAHKESYIFQSYRDSSTKEERLLSLTNRIELLELIKMELS